MLAANVKFEDIYNALGLSLAVFRNRYKEEIDADPRHGGMREHEPTAQNRKVVEGMAAVGVPQVSIAEALSISPSTLRTHYRQELTMGKIKAHRAVGQSLYWQAVGGPQHDWEKARPVCAIFWAKSQMGWKEQPIEFTTPDGRPLEIKDTSARDIILSELASIAERRRQGELANAPDGDTTRVPQEGLALLGPPGADSSPGGLDELAPAGGTRDWKNPNRG